MSYFRTIDEYEDHELQRELERRAVDRRKGICDYCGRSPLAVSCRFPERHHAPELQKAKEAGHD